jgi:hypothetical protein
MDEHPSAAANSTRRHETTDASARGVVYFGIGLFVSIVLSLWVASALFSYFAHRQGLGPPASPFENARQLPPASVPVLLPKPTQDMDQYLNSQEEMLTSYGWVDEKAGVVRIPINRAMDLLLQRGLPVETSPTGQGELQPGAVQQYTVPKGYTPER